MSKWRIKQMSELTSVSVRMLRHYDEIGLLKPSMRSSNGYRWYSEADLATLQQIIALKFFGFNLGAIKTMVQQKPDIRESLCAQQEMLHNQVESLRQALSALDTVLEKYKVSKSLDWQHLIELIERYRMAEEIKKTYAKNFSEKQKENYLSFRQHYLHQAKAWEETVEALNNSKLSDPEGPEGERVIQTFLAFNQAQLQYHQELKNTQKYMTQDDADEINAFIKKHVDCFKNQSKEGAVLNYEGSILFAKAQLAYQLRQWQQIHQEITKNLDAEPESEAGKQLATKWREFLAEHTMGASIDFHLGTMLLMQAARHKSEIYGQPIQLDDMKLCSDLMALDWMGRALKAH